MTTFKILKYNTRFFKEDLLFKGNLSPFYERVTNTRSKKVIYEGSIPKTQTYKKKILIVKDVPNYLYATGPKNHPNLKINKVPTYPGYLIELGAYKNFEDYLKTKFNTKGRYKIRMSQSRLELCFDISYKVYYGAISQEHYDFLFDYLKTLLERRFLQKNEANYELQFWEEYYSTMLPLILEKKAFLVVIYDGKKPIAMSVNVICDKIIFGNITSYDVDYAAFGLGSIHMSYLIKWAFENNFELIDLLKGYAYFKKNWANDEYNHERHIIYDSSSITSVLGAKWTLFRVSSFYTFFRLVKKMKLHEPYHKYKAYRYKRTVKSLIKQEPEVISLAVPDTTLDEPMQQVEILNDQYACLRKPIYDFAYAISEKVQLISVSRLLNYPNTYFAQGKSKYIKIIVKEVS